jgi:hypothetical protein
MARDVSPTPAKSGTKMERLPGSQNLELPKSGPKTAARDQNGPKRLVNSKILNLLQRRNLQTQWKVVERFDRHWNVPFHLHSLNDDRRHIVMLFCTGGKSSARCTQFSVLSALRFLVANHYYFKAKLG